MSLPWTEELSVAAPDLTMLELNHRWCNGLQVIVSALHLCQRDPATADDRISALCAQVRALAALHRRLSRPPPASGFEGYCRALCLDLILAFDRTEITPWVSMAEVPLSPRCAQHVALLVVELLTNVLKHGRAPENGGAVSVTLRRVKHQFELAVVDNFDAPAEAVSRGPRLVGALVQALAGTLTIQTDGRYATRVLFCPDRRSQLQAWAHKSCQRLTRHLRLPRP